MSGCRTDLATQVWNLESLAPERRLLLPALVPALLHELIVDMFRQHSELVCELLPRDLAELAVGATPQAVSADLSVLAPAEFHADHLVVFYTEEGAARLAVIVEVQNRRDARKQLTWPVYLAVTRARYECATVLLVVALDPSVARWARRSLEKPKHEPRYAVVSREELPEAPAPEAAPSFGLAVLGALAHRNLQTFSAAIGAISALPRDQAMVYFDAVLAVLPKETRQHLEDMMPAPQFRTPFLREIAEEGWRKGLAEGQRKGLAGAVIKLVRARLGKISAKDAARIRGLDQEEALSSLISAVAVAADADQIRRVLAALPSK